MPTPLSFSPEEMDLLLSLAAPIDQRLRPEFLAAVAAELEAASAQTGVGPGLGVLHRVGRVVQRKYWDSPQLPNASKAARALKGEVPSWNTRGEAAIYRSSSVLAFSHGPASGHHLPPRKLDGGGRDAVAASVPATLL
jgi:hypothetical protein